MINKITVEILFCFMSTLENCLIPTYLLWFSTRVQMEKKLWRYSTRNVNLYISILSYRVCILSYREFNLSYRACILSGFPFILSWKPFIRFCIYPVSGFAFIRFSVYRVSGFAFIRFCVYRVNRNISAFSWTNKRKTQRSPTFCYYCWVIKYCWFLFAVTICICFLKLKNYQYYYNSNLINSLWLHCFFLLRLHIWWSRKKNVWIEIPADKNYFMFWCADHVPAIKIFTGVTF